MRKTSLYLDDTVDEALQRKAVEEGVTKAEVIRRALIREATEAPTPPLPGIGALAFEAVPPEEIDAELTRSGFGT